MIKKPRKYAQVCYSIYVKKKLSFEEREDSPGGDKVAKMTFCAIFWSI